MSVTPETRRRVRSALIMACLPDWPSPEPLHQAGPCPRLLEKSGQPGKGSIGSGQDHAHLDAAHARHRRRRGRLAPVEVRPPISASPSLRSSAGHSCCSSSSVSWSSATQRASARSRSAAVVSIAAPSDLRRRRQRDREHQQRDQDLDQREARRPRRGARGHDPAWARIAPSGAPTTLHARPAGSEHHAKRRQLAARQEHQAFALAIARPLPVDLRAFR